jgi:hypothetical protein
LAGDKSIIDCVVNLFFSHATRPGFNLDPGLFPVVGIKHMDIVPEQSHYIFPVMMRCVPMGTLALPRYTASPSESFLSYEFV